MTTSAARLPTLFALWTAALLLGFWAVFALGGQLESSADVLAAAYAPATPVTEPAALAAAAVIVRAEYPTFTGVEPAIERHDEYGIQRWVIVYTNKATSTGLRISITVEKGKVQVTNFP